jgi:hypothetical protein
MADAAMLDAAALGDERVRALADALLARSRYAGYRRPKSTLQEWVEWLAEFLRDPGSWLPSWLTELWASIGEALLRFFGGFLGDEPLALLMRFLLAGAVLATSAWIVANVVRTLRAASPEGEAAQSASADAGDPGWLARAEGLAGQGRFLEAAHCTQLAALQLLLRGEWLALERSDTNRTLRQRLRAAPLPAAERGDFLALLDRLESRWFRDRAEDRDLYGAWRGLHARLEASEQLR